ncbi:MAG: prepilin-type N-terminal cleavage/methylation domain-containing protein [Patescibacteria group bacterium]
MEKLRKLIRARKGFTLVELIVVVMILMVITIAAVPGFVASIRRSQFEKTVADVVSLLNQARTQAIASELNSQSKIPTGGYGVFFDLTDAVEPTEQKAVLFVDDWNEAKGAAVNVNYADEDIANRILPDGIYTPSKDSELETVNINAYKYVQLTFLKGEDLTSGEAWPNTPGNTVTVIFKPPYAETNILGNSSVELQNFEAEFKLLTEDQTRTIKFNRVTTSPQVFKN